jgi:hypothetical protein
MAQEQVHRGLRFPAHFGEVGRAQRLVLRQSVPVGLDQARGGDRRRTRLVRPFAPEYYCIAARAVCLSSNEEATRHFPVVLRPGVKERHKQNRAGAMPQGGRWVMETRNAGSGATPLPERLRARPKPGRGAAMRPTPEQPGAYSFKMYPSVAGRAAFARVTICDPGSRPPDSLGSQVVATACQA